MKKVKVFEDFINESIDTKYWADYNKDTSGQSDPSFATKIKVFDIAFEEGVETWNAEADGKENQIDNKQADKIEKIAKEFFRKEKWISINVIHAMIAQEGHVGEAVINEADNKPSLDGSTGLIYYFDIPFTSEDMEELLSASKAILNAKFTPNKQFEIQPMIFIKDKVNGGEHTFSVAQIGILGAFFDKNKNKVASRKDF
jgi:hypothetical protein